MLNSSLLIGISSLLETLNDESDISKLIINNCSYQVFAGCYSVNQSNKIDQILIRFLKQMPNGILLDICLPFHHHPYYGLGRYILFQGRIIAVRVCQSELWPRYQTVYVPLSSQLQEYYRMRFGKNNYQNKVLFGEFYLSLQNCKIAMFFQSQLRNHCHDRFLEYYRQKCDIYSVINNCSVSQQDLQKYGQSQQSTKLKKQMSLFSFDNNIIINYCGLKGTTNEKIIYFSQDLIQQNYNFSRNNNNNIYQSHYVTMPIIIKQYYYNNLYNQNQLFYKKEIQNILFQENFIYEMKLKYKLKNYYHQSNKQQKQINRNISVITQHSNICLKMYLWYLYRNVNKKQPFVIGIPWSKNMRMIFSLLNQIASQVHIQKDQIILLYVKKTIKMKNQENQYAKKYRIQQLPEDKYLYLYEQDLNQIKAVLQSIQFGKVQICRKYISYFGSNHYRIEKTNKIQVKNNNHKIQFSQQFEGQKCILEHKESKNIKIQCLQCRKIYCYNCMLNKKSKIPIYQQIEKWKCNNCKQVQQNNQMKKINSETKEKLNEQKTEDIIPILQKKNSHKKNNKQIQKDQLDQLKIYKKRFKSHSKERFRSRSKEHKKDIKRKKLKNREEHSQQGQYNENKANFNNIELDKAKILWNQDLQSNQNNTFCRDQFKSKLIIKTEKINLENVEY